MEHRRIYTNTSVLDRPISVKAIYSVLLAILPVIQIYKVPFIGFGFATLFIGLFAPYAAFIIITHRATKAPKLFFCLFIAYVILKSNGDVTNIFLMSLVGLHGLAAFRNSIDLNLARKVIERVSIVMCVFLFFQCFTYYALSVRLDPILYPLCLDDLQYYAMKSLGGLYRPSSFFLEPSHFAQYVIVGLISLLFVKAPQKPKYKNAALVSLGILLSTSGMGITLVPIVWLWYVLTGNRGARLDTRVKTIFGALLVGIFLFCIFSQFSFFNEALQRIFGSLDGYNAIWGRTLFWDSYIGSLAKKDLIFGLGYMLLPNGVYFTGFMEFLYYYGIIGTLLFYLCSLDIFLHTKDFSRCLSFLFAGILLVANLTGFIMMVFYFCLEFAYFGKIDIKRN